MRHASLPTAFSKLGAITNPDLSATASGRSAPKKTFIAGPSGLRLVHNTVIAKA